MDYQTISGTAVKQEMTSSPGSTITGFYWSQVRRRTSSLRLEWINEMLTLVQHLGRIVALGVLSEVVDAGDKVDGPEKILDPTPGEISEAMNAGASVDDLETTGKSVGAG